MTDRLDSMKRLVRLQHQVKRLAEAELQTAISRKSEIEAMALGLDGLIGSPDHAPALVKMAMGQRRRVAVRHTEATRSLEAQGEATLEARSRFRLAERLVETIAEEESRVQERKDLERLIQAMANRDPGTSLP